ncbi:MAG: hypothetical protein FWH01_12280, partial [Oscillospiraceae bacterium]|nr:hypothetical protein [Oscillospiraceae bacterium]
MKSIARGGIFRRFIIVFVCVSIPFLSITLALIWNADYQARVEASQAMSQNADYFAQSFESEYSRIVSQHQSLILDKDLNDLTYHSGLMNRLTWTTTINRLQDKLSLFKSTNAYVEAVSVYMPPMMRVISSSGGGRYVYDDLTLSQIERLESIHGLYGGAFIADGYLTLYTVNRRGSTVNYVIETVLSSDQLFSDYVHFAGGTGCFLYNHDGLIAAPESMGPARALSATLSRSPGEETVLLDGKRHIAVKRQLYIAGLTFVSYYDESLLAAPAQWYRFLIWAAIVLFFGLACLYAYMTHKYMNRPLMVLMEHFKRLESGDMESRITG